ncbi:unnamed protein product [Acanthoscelides obtectus]|uniref:Uncharacterized protein n=1 Tax=Acanthoscelides obtectus TaxID=200917 RepID=A0A9P0PIS0_ACAOB|nr:unnamed protein product [Acanthoscelides obtectus]CAK1638226.1 hypothetical protein AOBTE_LOCUS10465 [Acanthoscelides obtectus]
MFQFLNRFVTLFEKLNYGRYNIISALVPFITIGLQGEKVASIDSQFHRPSFRKCSHNASSGNREIAENIHLYDITTRDPYHDPP